MYFSALTFQIVFVLYCFKPTAVSNYILRGNIFPHPENLCCSRLHQSSPVLMLMRGNIQIVRQPIQIYQPNASKQIDSWSTMVYSCCLYQNHIISIMLKRLLNKETGKKGLKMRTLHFCTSNYKNSCNLPKIVIFISRTWIKKQLNNPSPF